MKTIIAVPCMDTAPVKFETSLLALRRTAGSEMMVQMSSLIYDSRNKAAMTAIREGADRVLWLDSDMEFGPDLMERLNARIDEGMDLVTGLYFERKEPYRPVIYRKLRIEEREDGSKAAVADPYEDYPASGIFRISACGLGICMMTVKLLRDVTDKFGLPFTPVTGFGEDLAFCIRARNTGYTLWCDSSIRAGHLGMYAFTEKDYLRCREEMMLQQVAGKLET